MVKCVCKDTGKFFYLMSNSSIRPSSTLD